MIVNQTSYNHIRFAGNPFTIPLGFTAQSGNKLIVFSCGGAIPTISSSSGALTKRNTYGGGAQDVAWHDIDLTSAVTELTVTLNGEENTSYDVYEVSGLGAYIGGSSNAAGDAPSAANNLRIGSTNSIVVSDSAVVFSGYCAAATLSARPANATNKWRQLGPSGRFLHQGANQPGANTEYVYASAWHDVDETQKYPFNLSAGNFRPTSVWLNSDTCFTAAVAYASASPMVAPYETDVLKENSLPGTHFNNWFAGTQASTGTIAGYTHKTSYDPGETVEFKVDSTNNPFRVEVYRLGFYGWETLCARNVLDGFITGTPVVQDSPAVESNTGATFCTWTTTASWTIPSDACSGLYYVLFRRTDDTAKIASTHFTVKGPRSDRAVVVIPDCTYQAYNYWGAVTDQMGAWTGRSLYGSAGTADDSTRGYAVSFDRPYSTHVTQSNTYLFDAEISLITFLEAQGYDLSYVSDIDLETNADVFDGSSIVIPIGHHEYLTPTQWSAFDNIESNVLWCSSNVALWRTRFGGSDVNKRTVICYKNNLSTDSSPGFTGSGLDPVVYTGTWRGTVSNPDVRREDVLTGMMFKVSAPSSDNMEVPFAAKDYPIWRNSPSIASLTSGQSYTAIGGIGDEVDFFDSTSPTKPNNYALLSPTTKTFPNGANAAGTIYTVNTGPIVVSFIIFRNDNGRLVFNTGNWRGFNGISRWRLGDLDLGRSVSVDWQNALIAVVDDLGMSPPRTQAFKEGQDTTPTHSSISDSNNETALAYGLTVQSTGKAMMAFFL